MNFPSLHDSQIERVRAKEIKLCEHCSRHFVRDESPAEQPEAQTIKSYAQKQWEKLESELGKIQ